MVLALTAIVILPSLSFNVIQVVSVVSLSEAVMVNFWPSMLKRKLSRMGRLFLDTITRPIVCNRAESMELEITNFMLRQFCVTKL